METNLVNGQSLCKGNNTMANEKMDKAVETLKVVAKEAGKAGVLSVTQGDNVKLLAELGVSKQVVEAVAEARNAIHGAANVVLGDKLIERMTEAREAGNDPADEKVELRIAEVGGQRTNYTLQAKRTNRDPRGGDFPPIVSHGRFGVGVKISNSLNAEVLTETSEKIKKFLGEDSKKK